MLQVRCVSIAGEGPPTSVRPQFVGQIYYDKTNKISYIAESATGDWRVITESSVNAVVDMASAGVNYIRFLSQPNPDDYFTINGRVFMYDPTGGSPYDVSIVIGGSIALTILATYGAINGDTTCVMKSYPGAGNNLMLFAKESGVDTNYIVEESTGSVRLDVAYYNSEQASDAKARKLITVQHFVKSIDVTSWAAGGEIPIVSFVSTESPFFGSVDVLAGETLKDISTIDIKVQEQEGSWIISIKDSGAVLAQNDLILMGVWI